MRSLFVPLKLSAEARKLRFVTDLDPSIDRAATYTSVEGDLIKVGVFVGDEQRLRYVPINDFPELPAQYAHRQVVTNLASNACKFTPAGGEVRIATRLLAEASSGHSIDSRAVPGAEDAQAGTITVRIDVTDTGSGIHRKDMVESKLFSSFSQTEQGRLQGRRLMNALDCRLTQSTGGKGTGLGLAIVRQIVQLSGGRLRVRSRVGVGTTFSVDIPLRLQPLEGRSSTPAMTRPSSGTHPPATPNSPSMGMAIGFQGRGTAKMLSDPMLSPPAHVYHNSQLMSLARVQPVLSQASAEEEVAATHAAASLPHVHAPGPPPDLANLPAPADAFARVAGPSAHASSFARGLRVLVVDDDNMTRTLMRRMLGRHGCVVDVAENGQVALDAITADAPAPDPGPDALPHGAARYAVMFLDNQMPVLGGLDVVRALRKGGHSVFVVGVTGNALLTDQREVSRHSTYSGHMLTCYDSFWTLGRITSSRNQSTSAT
jgi:osomolarity two-component system sensor histidine kinase SLN1